MGDSKNANKERQTKCSFRINFEYVKKQNIDSTDRAFHGLQNDVFSFSVRDRKVTQNCSLKMSHFGVYYC
jgi:hypothetical protein